MAVGDCERAFAAAAGADGVVLVRARVPWLNQRGHFALPDSAREAAGVMADIFDVLDGNTEEQSAKRLTPLPGDFFHEPSGTFIEIDESQHFTTWRLRSLESYPAVLPLGFDLNGYRELCRQWAPTSDRFRASKGARGFGEGGRQRQRAYHDALRDVVVPAMGHPPVIRVAAPLRDGAAAYRSVRATILDLTQA
jgi:hypothetical protein